MFISSSESAHACDFCGDSVRPAVIVVTKVMKSRTVCDMCLDTLVSILEEEGVEVRKEQETE